MDGTRTDDLTRDIDIDIGGAGEDGDRIFVTGHSLGNATDFDRVTNKYLSSEP